jgi:hypothetical protein
MIRDKQKWAWETAMSRFKRRHYSAAACSSEGASPRRFPEIATWPHALLRGAPYSQPPLPPRPFLCPFTGAVNKESPERVHFTVRGYIDKHLIRPVDLLIHRYTRIPQCDTKGRRKTGKQNDTHILIPGCVAHQILNNVLCRACAHSSPSSWATHGQLGPATLPRILSVFVPLPLVGKP